jgi:predicted transcriptional regulator
MDLKKNCARYKKNDWESYPEGIQLFLYQIPGMVKTCRIIVVNVPPNNNKDKVNSILSPSVIIMHIPTPEELRARREALGMKQTELAKRAGISQSMVARIEAGNVDPRISTLSKIIAVLNSAEPKKIRAAQIMHTPVLCVQPHDAITRAVEIFEKNNISQLPVIERGVPVGCISETVIVKAIEQQRLHKTHLFFVRDFMEPGFPTVPPDMDVETVINILQQNHAVLVVEGRMVRGVITKHDLISLIV